MAATASAGSSAHPDFYYRRIGICEARVGHLEGALDAYQKGWQASELSHDDEMLAENIHGAALMLMRLGRLEEAYPLAQRENALTQKCGHPAHMIRAMWLVADMDVAAGRSRQGLQLLEAALKISRASNDKTGTAILLDNLASSYFHMGDVDRGIAMEAEALPLLDPANKVGLALTLGNLGQMQLDAGRTTEAAASLAKALEAASGPDAWRVRIGLLISLARMALDAGRYSEADARSSQALELATQMKVPQLASGVLHFRAEMMLFHPGPGGLAEALEAAENAVRFGRTSGSVVSIYEALFSRGAIKDALGEHEAAGLDFDDAIAVCEMRRAETSGEAADLRGEFENVVPLYRASVKNLILRNQPEAALRRAEQAKARVLMDILLRGGVDEQASMNTAETAERSRLKRNLAAANDKAVNSPSAATAQRAATAAGQLRQFEHELYAGHPELALQAAHFHAAGLQEVAGLLNGEHTALLDYFALPSGIALFVVRKSQVSAFVLPDPKNTLSAEIHHFREELSSRDLDYKTAARHLYDRLLGPALPALGTATDWIISPDSALWETPFAALIDPAGRHVLETRTLELVPSLTATVTLRQRKRPEDEARIPLLAIGNPLPSPYPLPDAAEEVRAIGKRLAGHGSIVLTGTTATKQAFLAGSQNARYVHLAAHAGLNDRDPMASFIAFGTASGTAASGDGILTARDVMDMHLRADLVVLSGCDTALGAARPGEGMIGMGWALAVAGASGSVLSYWKIDSAVSKDFMVALYQRLATAPPAAALREASLEIMKTPGHRHPFYWAPFTLWGS